MRKFILSNAQIFTRFDNVERIFKAIEDKGIKPSKGIFFDGQIFDAHRFVSDLIRSASKSIILIDNYIDDSAVYHFGASLKDLGNKWFAFSKFDKEVVSILERL